jgi:hypothetical protein
VSAARRRIGGAQTVSGAVSALRRLPSAAVIRQKPSYPDAFADEDRDPCFHSLDRLYAVKDQMRIIPTHDHHACTALLD